MWLASWPSARSQLQAWNQEERVRGARSASPKFDSGNQLATDVGSGYPRELSLLNGASHLCNTVPDGTDQWSLRLSERTGRQAGVSNGGGEPPDVHRSTSRLEATPNATAAVAARLFEPWFSV